MSLEVIARQKPRAALMEILKRYQVERAFPPEVEQEVRALERDTGIDDPKLEDLTHLPFVTIDNEDSRDLDQALHIERHKSAGGGFVLRYALADASHFVKPTSALFKEALSRGVSYYLPQLVVPMLPPELSEGLISLNPNVARRALVFVMTLDRDGHCLDTEILRARIRSRAQLSYNGVQRFIDNRARGELRDREFTESLQLMREVGELRIELSRRRDVVNFRRRNVEVELVETPAGQRFQLIEEERNDVSLWNEQISLLCNMEGASYMARRSTPPGVQPVYRVHEAPSSESFDHLERVIDSVVQLQGLEPKTWCWKRRGESSKSLADYLDELPLDESTRRIRQAIERQILITNQRSVFSSEPGRHFALGVTPYSRFSSPMREVVGIFTHKEALEKLGISDPTTSSEEDEEIRERVIAAANGARERQRRIDKDLTKLAVDDLFAGELEGPLQARPTHQGTILGITATRLYVRLDEPPADLKVYVSHLEKHFGHPFILGKESYQLIPEPHTNGPHLKLGDAIALRCLSYEERGGKWVFSPV